MDINVILDIGLILLAAVVAASVIKYVRLPRITSYIVMGVLIGPSFLNLVSPELMKHSDLFTNVALSFIAFDLGKKFSLEKLKSIGLPVFGITISQVLTTFGLVSLAVYFLMNTPPEIAMLYGAIACATAPAATILVVREFEAEGRFADTLLGTVALDDGIGILIFAVVFAVAESFAGIDAGAGNPLVRGLIDSSREIFGAVILGTVLGTLLSQLPRVIDKSSTLMIYTLGVIMFNTGLCIHFGLSALLANMALGIAVENISEEGVKFFGAVEKIESPFYVLFFVLAGAHLQIGMIPAMSLLGVVYLVSRVAGKTGGTWLGAALAGEDKTVRRFMGLALLPQAGVALGFALIVKSAFPSEGPDIFLIITATTVFFEILGPVLTEAALKASGEID
jgi:Kef-type K+ transport system membrane component KefB